MSYEKYVKLEEERKRKVGEITVLLTNSIGVLDISKLIIALSGHNQCIEHCSCVCYDYQSRSMCYGINKIIKCVKCKKNYCRYHQYDHITTCKDCEYYICNKCRYW